MTMDPESIVDLAQPQAQPSPWRAVPVLAPSKPSSRESGAGKGLASFAALAIFMAGMAAAVAVRGNIQQAALPAAASRPALVVLARTPATAPVPQPLVRPASVSGVDTSLRPFLGESEVVAAGADGDAFPAAPEEDAALASRQAQEAVPAPQPKPFNPPHLKPMPYFIQVVGADGLSDDSSSFTGEEDDSFRPVYWARHGQGFRSFAMPSLARRFQDARSGGSLGCPYCDIRAPGSRQDRQSPYSHTR
jgi:hypothetical protein